MNCSDTPSIDVGVCERGPFSLGLNAKLALTLTIATVCVSAPFRNTWPLLALLVFSLPLLWLLRLRRFAGAAVYVLLTVGVQLLLRVHSLFTSSFGVSLLLILTITRNFLPGLTAARLTKDSSTLSEFLNGMRKIHLPMHLVLAIAVLFRFVPTLREERRSIRAAVRMRGLGGSQSLRHPLKAYSYSMIPWLNCSARIGDELTRASLCRGLSLSRPRTVWPQEAYTLADRVSFIFCLLCLLAWIFSLVAPEPLRQEVARWTFPQLGSLLQGGSF